jgi:hypothetical protein
MSSHAPIRAHAGAHTTTPLRIPPPNASPPHTTTSPLRIQRYEAEQEQEERQRNVIIRGLEERVGAARCSRDGWASRMAAAVGVSELVAKRVQSIFFKIQCDHYLQTLLKDGGGGGGGGGGAAARRVPGLDAMASMLSSQAITESNMLAYMSLIEQRSVQIVTTYAQRLQATGLPVKFLSGPQRPPGWEVSHMIYECAIICGGVCSDKLGVLAVGPRHPPPCRVASQSGGISRLAVPCTEDTTHVRLTVSIATKQRHDRATASTRPRWSIVIDA